MKTKRTFWKLLGLTLAIIMTLALVVSCGSSEEPATGTKTAAPGETATGTAEASVPASATPDPSGEPTASPTASSGVEITSLKLSKSGMTMHVGEKQQLEYVVTPADADTSGLVWSVQDTSVATVENGLVTAVGEGTTTVFIKTYSGYLSQSCKVVVQKGTIKVVPVQGITVPARLLILKKGETYDFTCTAQPSDATDPTLQYRVESAANATIDQNGKITATDTGLNLITVTSGSISESCVVVIKNEDGSMPASLTGKASVQEGKTTDLTTVNFGMDLALTLVSSAPEIATVSGKTVTGVKAGSATISVQDDKGNELYIFNVTVTEKPTNLPVTGIKINKDSVTVKVGETVKLTATLLPEGAIERRIEWINESKGAIYNVTQDGEITGVAVGSKYVTVYVAEPLTEKSYTYVCMVNVVSGDGTDPTPTPPPTSDKVKTIKVENDHITMKVGDTIALTYTIVPASAQDVKVEWINEAKKFSDYLEIDTKTGTVKALKAFTPTDSQPAVTIYIDGSKTENGKSITKCIWITVVE